MKIDTTVNKLALLRHSTNIRATAAEHVRLVALADKLGEQFKAAHVLPDAVTGNGPIALDLTAQDVTNLSVCMERFEWPFDRFAPKMRREVVELSREDIPSWIAQATLEAQLECMTPAQRKALAAKAEGVET